MNKIRSISLLICCLFLQAFVFAQNQIRIIDETERFIGRFKTQLYMLEGNELDKLRGNFPKIKADGQELELILRVEDLRWFEDENISNNVTIAGDKIKLNDSGNLKLSSKNTSFDLSPRSDQVHDIRFKVLKNGDYTLSIPYAVGQVKGKFVQNLNVSGLSSTGKADQSLGAIADIRKAWKDTDKKDILSIKGFLSRYEDDKLAQSEGLITIAEKSLMRAERSLQEEQEDWERISDSDNKKDLEDFIEKYPESKFLEAAKAKLGLEANVLLKTSIKEKVVSNSLTHKGRNIYSLDLTHLTDIELNVSHPDEIEVYDTGGNAYELKVKGSKNYKIEVKENSTGQNYTFNLDNTLKAGLEQIGKDFIFAVKGGVSPFSAEFYKVGESSPQIEGILSNLELDELNQIRLESSMLSKTGMDGKYERLVLRDATTESEVEFPIDVNIAHKTTSSRIILFGLLAAIVLGGAFMFFFNRKKQKTRDEYLAKAKAMQQTQKVQVGPQSLAGNLPVDSAATPSRKITISKSQKKFVPPNGGSNFISSGKMKITRRDAKGGRLTESEFTEALKGDKYAFMDLQELWPDTAIKELFLSKECIKALGTFLREENLDKAIAEMEGAIPEVGGFLMGYHQLDETSGDIRVTMDEFVPFVPEYHDVFKIEIGTATLVQELGDAQDTHPDKDVIGWFHTHPGHGLFLSNSDLSVQRHFPQKFQIAMEIDSLTPTLDTAFFTRKHDGSINNVEHRKKGAKWFSWKKIEKI